MSGIKVKLFHSITSATPGVDLQRELSLEKDLNAFLASVPGIKIIDVKLASSAAAVGDRVAHYSMSALLLYEVA